MSFAKLEFSLLLKVLLNTEKLLETTEEAQFYDWPVMTFRVT